MIVLSHISAARYWLTAPVSPLDCFLDGGVLPAPLKGELAAARLPVACTQPERVHVLVGDRNHTYGSNKVAYHLFQGCLPPGSIRQYSNDVAVVSPELCFMQMATIMGFYEHVMFGLRLCGSYYPKEGDIWRRLPVTSKASIQAMLDSHELQGKNGVSKSKRALRYVCDGSASPRESMHEMLACLDKRSGGFHFRLPELNRRFDLDYEIAQIVGHEYYRCDMFWPNERVAVEYDSDDNHLVLGKIENDSVRRSVLESMGIKVVTFGRLQLNDSRLFELTMRRLARELGMRIGEPFAPSPEANASLRSYLFSDNIWPSLK